jgi:glucose/arabinose dehydrogenase/chitodextrinase
VCAAVALALAAPAARAAELPGGFEDVPLVSGLRHPTAVTWAPDGRMFVAEKEGRVRVVEADGRLRPEPLIDVSGHVNAYWDRGMTDVAVAHDFASSGRLYLFYAADRDPAHPEAAKGARLTSVTVASDGSLEEPDDPENVILGGAGEPCPPPQVPGVDCLPIEMPVHGTGTVVPAPDGTLYVSFGDGKDSALVDDPLTFRPFDPEFPSGKVLHVDREGRGLPGHPFCPAEADLSRTCTKVFATGLRNAFRIAPLPDGGLLVGDVGWNLTEEVDVARGGENFGWPCREGDHAAPVYDELERCRELAGEELTEPVRTYGRDGGSSVVAGPTYEAGPWPDSFDGRAFVADTVSGRFDTLEPAAQGRWTATPFARSLPFPVDLALTPAGDLAYVALLEGSVRAIRWSPDNRTPVARAAASPTYGPPPLEVEFDATASSDADGHPLEYSWRFGDGSVASGPSPRHTYTEPGLFTARLTVTDALGASAHADTLVAPGNTPPALTVAAPIDGATYRVGDTIALAATAADGEDALLPSGAITWDVTLRHASHEHPLLRRYGPRSEFTTATTHGADSHYEVTVRVTDIGGLATSRTMTLRPRLAPLALASEPPGALLGWDGRDVTAPVQLSEAAGYRSTLSAPETMRHGGRTYEFAGWDDGGTRVREVMVPDEGASLVARYARAPGAEREPEASALPAPAPQPAAPRALRLGFTAASRDTRALQGGADGVTHARAFLRTRRGCRFWSPRRGRFDHRRGTCTRPRWLRLRLARSQWRLPLRGKLPPGRYVLMLRGRAGDRVVERTVRFRVGR